jgi:thiamine biosynthesis lipoprotein
MVCRHKDLKLTLPVLILVTVVVSMICGCSRGGPPRSEFVLGTVCTVNLYNRGSERIYREIFSRLREIDDRMSANRTDTDLAAVNAQAGTAPAAVRADLLEVVGKALDYAEITGGAFDPTVGPLVALWGIGQEAPQIPPPEEIEKTLSLVNWRDVRLDTGEGKIFLTRPGMGLDLGAIAKGYAADEAVRIIREARIPRGIVDLGGNIFALGSKEGNRPWRVGIQNPLGPRGSYIGVMEVRDKTLVTSGVYERYFEAGGERYHHILSTRDGYPVRNGLLSVTIIARRSIDADSLSTGVFAMGYEPGKALVESLSDTEALFIFDDLCIRATAGALRDFTLTDTDFTLER